MKSAVSKLLLIGACLLTTLTPNASAEAKIEGDLKVKQYKLGTVTVKGAPSNSAILWRYDKTKLDAKKVGDDDRTLWFTGAPGTYTLDVFVFSNTEAKGKVKPVIEELTATIVIEGKPVPPTPDPDPVPDPDNVVPIPGDGLRVIMVYDKKQNLSPGQDGAIHGILVRDYLNAKCPVGPDGKQREWWIFDKDTDVSGIDKKWQDAMKRPRKSLPWIIISNGKRGFEGPLPDNSEKTLELLKKYGG